MKIAVGSSQTTSNIQGGSRSFKIQASGKAFRVLSSSLYNYKPLAVVREISCNARDAHAMCGKLSEPFHVRLPSMDDPHFVVRDFGPGMAEEDIFGLYTTYFQSSKTGDNDAIGGFGLGSKSPLSYSNSFQVASYHGGMKRTYLAFQNDSGEPDIYRLTEQESKEPNGLEVIVPVVEADIRKFHRSAANVFRFFETRPTVFNGKAVVDSKQFYEFDFTADLTQTVEYEPGRRARFYNNRTISEISNDPVWAKMGDVIYPISVKHVFEDGRPDEQTISRFFQSTRYGKLIVDCNIGELDINAGREGLSYDKATIARLKTVLSAIYSKLVQFVNNQIASAKYLEDAIRLCHDHTRFFGNQATEGMFSWRGISLVEAFFISIPSLIKNSQKWNAMLDALNRANPGGRIRFSVLSSARGEQSVRMINGANIERIHINFKQPTSWVIVDEPISGARGSLRDRLGAAFGNDAHYKRNVFIIRSVDVDVSPATGNENTRLAHKSIADARTSVGDIVKNWDLFSDVRFLSELPTITAVGGTQTTAASATRTKEEVYAINIAPNAQNHLYRLDAFYTKTLDEDSTVPQLYLIGNKSKIKFLDLEIGVSRTTTKSYQFNGSYVADLLHYWARYKLCAASAMTIHYVSDAQAERLKDNPKWIRLERQIVKDAAKLLTGVGPFWNVHLSQAGLYDRDVFNAACTHSKSFNAAVGEWKAMMKTVETDRRQLEDFVTCLLNNVPSAVDAHWDDFVSAAGLAPGTKREWANTFNQASISLNFQEFVGKNTPLLVTISQRNTSWNEGWERDVGRHWDTTPNKITVTDFIDQKIKGTLK